MAKCRRCHLAPLMSSLKCKEFGLAIISLLVAAQCQAFFKGSNMSSLFFGIFHELFNVQRVWFGWWKHSVWLSLKTAKMLSLSFSSLHELFSVQEFGLADVSLIVAALCRALFKNSKMSSASFGIFHELFSVQVFGLDDGSTVSAFL